MSEGIAYQNKDIISKVFTESFGTKSLEVYGLHVPKIVGLLPTNLPAVEANELRIDNLLELEDGSVGILDYESDYSEEDKAKYLNYISRVYKRLVADGEGEKDIRMIVIYTADVNPKTVKTKVKKTGFSINIDAAFLSELNSEGIRKRLSRKITRGESLLDQEMMELIILPLTYRTREKKQEMIKESIDLAKQVKDEKQSTFLVAGIIVFSDKVIDENTREKAKGARRPVDVCSARTGVERRWMRMTQIGKMFEQEKQEAVNDAVSNAVNNILFEQVNEGVVTVDYASKKANLSVADFTKAMEEHGYRVPQIV